MPSTILVTGANGQLGMELQVLAKAFTQYQFIFTTKDVLPIHDESIVHYFFKKYQPQYCINCAAYTAVDKAETDVAQATLINETAPLYLAQASLLYHTKLIHISTDYVFDGATTIPYTETATTNPLNVYGHTKLNGETNVLQTNPNNIVIRTSWVYSEFGSNFVKTMIRLLQTKESINVINDQIGSPTYAASLATIIMQIITLINTQKREINGIYNYSSNTEISWYNFATDIKYILNSNCNINAIPTTEYPTPAIRSKYSVLHKTKIVNELGIELSDWKSDLKICINKLLLNK